MGYTFELQHANMVAHLIDGNIEAIIDSLNEKNNLNSFIEFINSNHSERKFFSSLKYEHEFEYIINQIESFLQDHSYMKDKRLLTYKLKPNILKLSRHIGRAKVKALLLPSHDNPFLSDKKLLKKLVDIHPEDSCLILQTPPIDQKSVQFFNTFRGFEDAFNHYDEFPGILLWDDFDTFFVPVQDESETVAVFQHILSNAKYPIKALKKFYSMQYKNNNYLYLLHLSDLHLGKVNHERKQELLRLIKTHSIYKEGVPIIPIITGDLMDTPNQENGQKVKEFIAQLNSEMKHKSIFVFGNHDIDNSGFISIGKQNKQAPIGLVQSEKIEKFDNYKLIIIKFCSNQNGQFARGEIGEQQLVEIAEELDGIENLEDYTIIALLHHHPIKIDQPNWYKGALYERILSPIGLLAPMQKLIDANRFIDWCKERQVKMVLHGHKHIPNIVKKDTISYVGAGSSTGNVQHIENEKTYISFNVIKYDLNKKRPTQATIYFEEIIGTHVKQHMSVDIL